MSKLPVITIKELYTHDHINKTGRYWIAIGEASCRYVYDITDYIDKHPGRNAILNYAGDIADDILMDPLHAHVGVLQILKPYIIGRLESLPEKKQ